MLGSMKYLLAGLTALFPALGMIGSVTTASREDDEAVVTRVLGDYYRAFSTLDAQLEDCRHRRPRCG
jgi:hypothetical protein